MVVLPKAERTLFGIEREMEIAAFQRFAILRPEER